MGLALAVGRANVFRSRLRLGELRLGLLQTLPGSRLCFLRERPKVIGIETKFLEQHVDARDAFLAIVAVQRHSPLVQSAVSRCGTPSLADRIPASRGATTSAAGVQSTFARRATTG